MTNEEYRQLLVQIREAKELLRQAVVITTVREQNLSGLLGLLNLADTTFARTDFVEGGEA